MMQKKQTEPHRLKRLFHNKRDDALFSNAIVLKLTEIHRKLSQEYLMDDNCHVEPVTKRPSSDEIQNVQIATLIIWGMGCQNCANRVHNSLISLQGVIEARVDHNLGKAQVAYNPSLATNDDLVAAVARAGGDGRHEYGAKLIS